VNLDWSELSKVVQVEIDQDKARLLGVSTQDLASCSTCRCRAHRHQFREGDKTIDVVLRGDRAGARHLSQLPDLALPTRAARACRSARSAASSTTSSRA
jgi:multidrug efflux pump